MEVLWEDDEERSGLSNNKINKVSQSIEKKINE